MIDDTLKPSVEKSSTNDSVENQEISKETAECREETAETVGTGASASEQAATETGEKTGEAPSANMPGAVVSEEEIRSLSSGSLKEIVQLFQKLVDLGDIMEVNRYAEIIKATFYKVLKENKIASGYTAPAQETEAGAAPEAAETAEAAEETPAAEPEEQKEEEVSVNPFIEIERAFKAVYAQYKSRRAEYFSKLEREKEENLKVREQIIEEVKALLETTEDLNKTFPAFRALQARWREAGPVPQTSVKDVYDRYQHNVELFYDYVKLNNDFRDLDFKKNLEAKVDLCEKAEALDNEENVVNAFAKLQKLHEEWKEFGPVAKEFREEIWERFRLATSRINKKHQAYFEGLKVQQKDNLVAKTALCEKAEEIAGREISASNGWNNASKELEGLQKDWKGIGYASKKENQKIYDRFRAACDQFYNRKREYYSEFKEQMTQNMEKKIAICEQAEAIMDSTDWKKTTDELIELQKQWKEIGPVSRKKSDQVWNRFRAACDRFFNNKEKNFGGADASYVDNLKAKQELLEEITAYEGSDEQAARGFAERWNAIGFVPFKEKDAVQESFRKLMQEKFPEFRLPGAGRGRAGARRNERRQEHAPVKTERDRLIQKFRKLESEIATYENNLGFFASSKKADQLIDEINKKIEAAKAELAELEEKINAVENNTAE